MIGDGWNMNQGYRPESVSAPAEDPRGGEHVRVGDEICCRPRDFVVQGCRDLCPNGPLIAARPAGDRAQPTEELRELRATMIAALPGAYPWGDVVDRLLAGPLAALLDAQAKVERVEALAKEYADRSETVADGFWKRHLWIVSQRLRCALGGTT